MDLVEVRLKINDNENTEKQLDLINSLLAAYRLNGQVLGREFRIFRRNYEYVTFLSLPDTDSLEAKYGNKYTNQNLAKLSSIGLGQPVVKRLGKELETAPICKCNFHDGYILYTSYLSLESPVRCLDCFGTIPLYRLPKTDDDEYYDIICWESNYQSCDRLQMNCNVGERFAMNQLSKLNSALTKEGREICQRISKLTQRNTYYYLYKSRCRSLKSERERVCPSCHQQWLLPQAIHKIFDFQCSKCSLLSNISWDVRSNICSSKN